MYYMCTPVQTCMHVYTHILGPPYKKNQKSLWMTERRSSGVQGWRSACWLLHPAPGSKGWLLGGTGDVCSCTCLWKAGIQLPVALLMSTAAIWCLDPLLLVAQIVSGVSAISSSLCRIISRSTVYLGTETAVVGSRKQYTLPLVPTSQLGSQCGLTVPSFCFCHGPTV